MGSIIIQVLLIFGMIGVGIGMVLKNNGMIGYNISREIGKKHMEYMGVEDKEEKPKRWDD